MTDTLDKHRNPDGTWNGVTLFAELTGLPAAEVQWMATRLQELLRAGVPRDQAKATVAREGKSKPWEGSTDGN